MLPHELENDQFVLSYELLYLLAWLIEHETESLKKLIAKAVKKGFKEALNQQGDMAAINEPEGVQQSIADFLGLMDMLLAELTSENEIKKILQRNLIPAINKIDASICDESLVACSLEKTSNTLEKKPNKNPQEVLFKELLKRWNPGKKKKEQN